ncbi:MULTISPECIES: SPFH domain-containing protein [Vibrio]|uniref:SPFH domain-containing protein n=1 Tax=Vibrio TaxID=662 RepID=UPI00078C77AC|nr:MULTISPECIES: SPFH domain-containing protein [Vibrio]BAU70787.1 hypothetical protein [Vibrio sp. 04Ya108]BBM67645.1 paraslipin [Vibrio alfacsensis]BCN27127.1 paraslipin [Vibrio alfacsensis]
MYETIVIGVLVLAASILVLKSSLVITPEGSLYVVEKLGKFSRTLTPGLAFLVPLVERVAHRPTVKAQIVELPDVEAFSNDNSLLIVSSQYVFKFVDVKKALYTAMNVEQLIENYCVTSLRNVMGTKTLDELLSSRAEIKAAIESELAQIAGKYGCELESYEILNITPTETTIASMEQLVAADRHARTLRITADAQRDAEIAEATGKKEAEVLAAEAEKQSAILRSQGELEAAKNDAEAIRERGKAQADANDMIAKSVKENGADGVHLKVATEYTEALKAIGESESSKTIMMPVDSSQLVGSIAGIAELLTKRE